ncbi:MAG TPA: helix-turn-helix transcriptional regulator [Prolixibacteraceae bacterium]|jgi:transcriptional regulator with XRE-family HTH domain|nr:helix-turn-helix transcriptional regulator [Prolixibacteraceae bacterium]
MDKIISDTYFIPEALDPVALARGMASRFRERRLELNLSRKTLAARSGVTESTLKRFENSHEISLKHLLMLAVVLGASEDFETLFTHKRYESLDDAIRISAAKTRQRGR